MATHSSTLARKIPWTEEPGSLVGCSPCGCYESDTTEQLHFHFLFSQIGEGNGNPLQYSCLKNPRDGGVWWAAGHDWSDLAAATANHFIMEQFKTTTSIHRLTVLQVGRRGAILGVARHHHVWQHVTSTGKTWQRLACLGLTWASHSLWAILGFLTAWRLDSKKEHFCES